MKLRKLKEVIDEAMEKAGDCNPKATVWLHGKEYEINRIGQFSVVPDLTINIKLIKNKPIAQAYNLSDIHPDLREETLQKIKEIENYKNPNMTGTYYKGRKVSTPLTKKGNEFHYIDSSLKSAETSAKNLMAKFTNPKGEVQEQQTIEIGNILCAVRAARQELPALLLMEDDI